MDTEKKYVGKWWIWFLFLIVITIAVLMGLRAFGFIGGTILEREVFKRSFQYTEARKSEIALYESQLALVEGKLMNPNLTEETRMNLTAQSDAIRIQLNVARQK